MITQSEVATEKIRDQIIRGDVSPGAHLLENPLSQQLGMSRTPVRTALNTLAQEGLLEYVAKRGYRVKEFTIGEIVEAYNVRATLEGMACRLVAEKGLDRWSKNKLTKCVEDGEAIIKKTGAEITDDNFDGQAWRQMNTTFHQTIIEAAENPFLQQQIRQIVFIPVATLFVLADWGSRVNAGNINRAQVDHINILDALERRQSARAESRMREHLENTGRVIQDYYMNTQKLDNESSPNKSADKSVA